MTERVPDDPSTGGIRAGADARPITPRLDTGPVFLAGFGRDRRATATHTDLFVRTLALREGEGRPFVLAVCDLIGVLREDTLAIRAAVADLEADVVVAATHTHSGPDTIGLWGPDERTRGVDDGHMAQVRVTVAASIRSAVEACEPAVMRFATTEVRGVIQNYRDPEILDEQIGAMAVDRPDGSAIATLLNVPVHPEVLGEESTVISADMAGAGARALEGSRGGVGIWVGADLGGMQSPAEGPRTPDESERKGAVCAAVALAALVHASAADDVMVRYRGAEVAIPLWNPRYREGMAAGMLRGDLREDGTLVTDAGILDLGAARMACWPGEVLPALGMACKERLGTAHPFLIGFANDELGYILPPEQWVDPTDRGDPGVQYEESMSAGPRTGPILQEALDALLDGA